ncbi:MAG: glycosyltransferase [Chromatiaceae bacterium]|nr:glycosyltransferase [Chromatiaceae bacterium]
MRVLHVGKFFPPFAGGIEHFLADLLPAQQALGIRVAALVHHEGPGWRGVVPPPDTTSNSEIDKGAGMGRGVGPDTAQDQLPPLIYRAPCLGRILYVPLSPTFILWLDRVIREFSPDLLHLHLPNTSAFSALMLPRARRLPWVVHWHADVVASAIDRRLALAYQLYRPFEQRLLAHSQAVIATSPPYLSASLALRPWRTRCHVIPLGLNPARLPEPDRASLDLAAQDWGHAGLRILVIGRLTYYKGHEILIRAAARLTDIRVLIVGGGEHQDRLIRLVHELGLGDRVSLLGHQTAAQVTALLASCDIYCLPSLERTEAFGLVLLEAMRFARPVVVSDIPGSGAPWLVRQAGNGCLVSPGDAVALAEALAALQADALKRQDLGEAGARVFEREFGIGPVATAIHGLYQRVLAEYGGPSQL